MSHVASEWMPWYIEDFWGSEHVAEMTDNEALLYLWCLGRQWQSGSLPADPAAVKRMAPSRFGAVFDESWAKVRDRFECGTDGRLRNAVCAEHLADVNATVQRKAEAGRIGGQASAKVRALSKATTVERPLNDRCESASTTVERPFKHNTTEQNSIQTPAPPVSRKARKEPEGSHARVIQHFTALYESAKPYGYGVKYAFQSGKDGAAVKSMLKATADDAELACRAITAAFESTYWFGEGLTLASIGGNLPKFLALASKPEKTQRPEKAPVSDAWVAQAREEFSRPVPTGGPALERRKLFENALRTRGLTLEAILGQRGGAA